jgi:hypothetical protein
LDELVSTDDSVTARRARISRLASLWKRVGYGALLLAIVAFGAALAGDFPGWLVTVTIAALVVGMVVLPVPIIIGYGVRAAEREEREERRARPA